jgi:hypothetical protein
LGINLLRIGLVQNITGYTKAGTYNGGRVLRSSAEARFAKLPFVLDRGLYSQGTSSGPWYPFDSPQNGQKAIPTPWAPSAKFPGEVLKVRDRPGGTVPLDLQKHTALGDVDNSRNPLTKVDFVNTFRLDVCAQVADATNAANTVYVRQATTNWTFDGTGTIQRVRGSYPWTQTGAGVPAPAAWKTVTDGTVPTAGGVLGNVLISDEQFR